MHEVLFSSHNPTWKTPKAVYQTLDAEFRFDHDPCPSEALVDGLLSEWGEVNYVNPPYGPILGSWLEKAIEQQKKGRTSVFLIPSRTDSHWWHDYVMKADEVRYIRGRLKFDDGPNSAPFPSAIVVFRGKDGL